MFEFFKFLEDQEACIDMLKKHRWPNGIYCPHCNHTEYYILQSGYKCANNQCYKKFNTYTNTPFQNTKLELKQWYLTHYLLSTLTYGISSYQIAKKVGVTQSTAWHLRHRVAEFFEDKSDSPLSGTLQFDEAVVGGRNMFRHWDKKFAWVKGEAGKDKTWVFGMVKDDERKARLFVVPDRKALTLKHIIDQYVEMDSNVVTDDYLGYRGLNKNFNHKVVKIKDKKRAAFRYKTDDGFHTNRIEGLWTQLKRSYKGVYHHMSPQHLQRYCNEISFRYEYSNNGDFFIFETLLSNMPNTIVRYKDLVAQKFKKAA